MARSLSLAIGRPTPSLGVREMIGGALRAVALIFAAGRVGAAVEAGHAPLKADLKAAGLENLTVLRPPYRF